jgi:Tfp pilus assembly protein PilV
VSEAAVIGLRTPGLTRLTARLRDESGFGLVELLIALLVLNIGIFATFAAFTSGALALRRASRVSTATAVADQQMEKLRNLPFASIPPATQSCTPVAVPLSPSSVTGADGRMYDLSESAAWCSQLQTGTYTGSAAVKVVTLTVSDPTDSNVVVTTSSTFSACAQDMNQSTCQS